MLVRIEQHSGLKFLYLNNKILVQVVLMMVGLESSNSPCLETNPLGKLRTNGQCHGPGVCSRFLGECRAFGPQDPYGWLKDLKLAQV